MDTLRVQGRVRLEDLPPDSAWPKHEIIDGSLLVTPWAGTTHCAVVGDTYFALRGAAPASVGPTRPRGPSRRSPRSSPPEP